MLQQPGGIGFRVATVAVGGVAPLVVYFVLHGQGVGDTEALALAWFVPVLWTLGSSIWRRKIDLLTLGGVLTYGIAVGAAVVLGAGSLPLKLHRAFITGVVGSVCLVSFAIRRPIVIVLVLRVASSRGVEDAIDADMVRRLGRLTLIIGVSCMGDTAIHTALAILLPTATFLILSIVTHVVVSAGVLASAYLLFRARLRSSRASPSSGVRKVTEDHIVTAADHATSCPGTLVSHARPQSPSQVKE